MVQWDKYEAKLRDGHGWKAKPGHKIFVADRGAVRFDIPASWTMEVGKDSIRFLDRKPPDDDCLLQVSYLRCPPGIDWSRLPLVDLLADIVQDDPRKLTPLREATHTRRPDMEIAWIEASFHDPGENREARSRSCFARNSKLQAFITMDFWPEHIARFHPVWVHVLKTVRLGQYVADPTQGPNEE